MTFYWQLSFVKPIYSDSKSSLIFLLQQEVITLPASIGSNHSSFSTVWFLRILLPFYLSSWRVRIESRAFKQGNNCCANNVVVDFTLITLFLLVSLSWWWWRGGLWQYCKWWSKVSKVLIYRSHFDNEKGKNFVLTYMFYL